MVHGLNVYCDKVMFSSESPSLRIVLNVCHYLHKSLLLYIALIQFKIFNIFTASFSKICLNIIPLAAIHLITDMLCTMMFLYHNCIMHFLFQNQPISACDLLSLIILNGKMKTTPSQIGHNVVWQISGNSVPGYMALHPFKKVSSQSLL